MDNMKILAIQFQYLGDAVFMTPALQEIKNFYPNAELHVLVANEIFPILKYVNYIDKLWGAHRIRGQLNILNQLPLIFKLRKEKFDRIVDFGGNDRGAFYSFLIGANYRLGIINKPNNILHKICYNQKVFAKDLPSPYIDKYTYILKLWGIQKNHFALKITFNKKLITDAKAKLVNKKIICHISTSQPKKEWPVKYWFEFYKIAKEKKYTLIFTAGTTPREINLLEELKQYSKEITVLNPTDNLELFIAIISQAECLIANDTGPLHFASALGLKTLGLFGIHGSVNHAAPNYNEKNKILSKSCKCKGQLEHYSICKNNVSCMSTILPRDVFFKFNLLMK
jgi:ADP-heptose:LPS heptosyltransferase